MRTELIAAALCAALVSGAAQACIGGEPDDAVFLAEKPAAVPAGLFVLKVDVPARSTAWGDVDARLAEPAFGLAAGASVHIAQSVVVSSCPRAVFTGGVAYVVGVPIMVDGRVVFAAVAMPMGDWKSQRPQPLPRRTGAK